MQKLSIACVTVSANISSTSTCRKMGEQWFCAWEDVDWDVDDWRTRDEFKLPVDACLVNWNSGTFSLPDTVGIPRRSENGWPNASQSFSTSAWIERKIWTLQQKPILFIFNTNILESTPSPHHRYIEQDVIWIIDDSLLYQQWTDLPMRIKTRKQGQPHEKPERYYNIYLKLLNEVV